MARRAARYNPGVFDVRSRAEAREIILTPERALTTSQRWDRETPHLLSLIKKMRIKESSVVLDFGCGIGRLARELIVSRDCRVVGADISVSMRGLGVIEVGSPKFMACDPSMLDLMPGRFDAAIAIWSLQHVRDLKLELGRIASALKPGGHLFVVNEGKSGRCVPTDLGWIDDGKDLRKGLAKDFTLKVEGKLDPKVVSEGLSRRTFWAIYTRK